MFESATKQLQELAAADPTAAPLAALQVEALRAATDPSWESAAPALDPARLTESLPLLHGLTLTVDAARVRDLLLGLAGMLGEHGEQLDRGLTEQEALALVEVSVMQDEERLCDIAEQTGRDIGVLATLGGLAALPMLLACGRRAAPHLERSGWDAGYCPVCAAWPLLAELRGLEQSRWLRCGRCGAGWPARDHACVFCDNADFATLSYLAPEADRESRRAATCDRCQGYLKTLTTLGPLPPEELALHDLSTLELDMAALEAGYARPATPAFPLRITLERAPRRTGWWSRR